MRIFVGYGYNERDRWIETHVVPLLVAFGCQVVHGKAVFGGALAAEVVKAIRTTDAMIGFTTRRDAVADGQFRTHDWVVHELLTAHAQDPQIPWVEVREHGVISPGGVLDAVNAQRIHYREEERAACLVEIAQAIRRFREVTSVTTIRLGPVAAVEQIAFLLDDPSFTGSSRILRGTTQLAPQATPVIPIRGGLYMQLRGLAAGDLVRITIAARGRTWRSDYELVDTVDVQVRE
jgi:hypothetical protein